MMHRILHFRPTVYLHLHMYICLFYFILFDICLHIDVLAVICRYVSRYINMMYYICVKHRICLTHIFICPYMSVHISGAEMHYIFISRVQFLGRLISVNIHVSGANIVHEYEYICICVFTCLSNALCYQSAFIPRYKFLHTNICPLRLYIDFWVDLCRLYLNVVFT